MKYLVRLAAIAAAAWLAPALPAAAQCDEPPLAGIWENREASADQDLTRVEIIHTCTPGQTGAYSLVPGSTWTVRAYAKCAPRDCRWGREAAKLDSSGRLVVVFPTFSARRSLRITPAGDAIRVEMHIDYHTAARKDVDAELTLIRGD